eukprot:2469422-Amphidinium_carterae.1
MHPLYHFAILAQTIRVATSVSPQRMLAAALRRPETFVAVVGASRGIGLALVQGVLERHHAQILATCRKPDEAKALNDLAGQWPGR